MRRVLAACAAALLIAGAAAAQHTGSEAQVPDVPSGAGTLRGAIENPDDPSRVGDVEILLYALPASGTPGLRRGRSDANGRFAFEGISNDPSTAYLVGARYGGIPYPGERISFAAGETEKRATVRVGDPTADPRDVSVVEARLELAYAGGRIGISELHRFENRGARTVFVPAAQRQTAKPAFRAVLPAGAADFNIPLGIEPEGLVHGGDHVEFFGPLYPSSWPGPLARDQGLAFQYTLPASNGPMTIEKQFPSGASRVVVVVAATGPKVEVVGAREEKPEPPAKSDATKSDAQQAEDEATTRRFVLDRVAPGGKVTLKIDVPETRVDPGAVKLEESRVFLELDDAALSVQQDFLLTVSGDKPVVAPPGGALLTLPVPEGAKDVRFDRDAFAMGLAPDEGNGGVLRGPLPPGETRLQIAYNLPVTDPRGAASIDLRFGRTLPLLSVYAADTGLSTESERLHRRRPVKTTDRTYIALEAFQVEPNETVGLSLAPLATPARLPQSALVVLVALAAGLVVSFVATPLRAARKVPAAAEVDDAARDEREAVYVALRDLDHDHETAKLSDEDYQSMRGELRARAAALLKSEEAAASAAATGPGRADVHPVTPAPPAVIPCPACAAPTHASDRFCAQCGARLEAAEARA